MFRTRGAFSWGASLAVVALLFVARSAPGAAIHWTIDSSQSYIRLNLFNPLDQYQVRTQALAAWTDAGGRLATVAGDIASVVELGSGGALTSIQFLGPAGTALDDKSLRPNPAVFSTKATNSSNPNGSYTSTAATSAAYGGALTVSQLPNSAVGRFSFTDVSYALSSGVISLGAPSTPLPASSTTFGIGDATFGFDGATIAGFGQLSPDSLLQVALGGTNSLPGSITWLGGNLYQLTYQVSVEAGAFTGIQGFPLVSTLSGVIVATATIVPEPASFALAAVGSLALLVIVRRRK
jgi:hypothetical protein